MKLVIDKLRPYERIQIGVPSICYSVATYWKCADLIEVSQFDQFMYLDDELFYKQNVLNKYNKLN